jgi:hypothetical protein
MARVPVITSSCPLRWNAAPRAGKDFCGQCQRRVHNLDAFDDAERQAFLSGCAGKVCVYYTVRRRKAAPSALGLGIAAAAGMLGAGTAVADEAASPLIVAGEYCDPLIEEVVMVGGTQAGRELEWIDEQEAKLPDKADLPEIDAADWLPTPAVAGDIDPSV